MLLTALLAACAGSEPPPVDTAATTCEPDVVLFGQPNDATGLTDAQCAPECADCGGGPWGPPAYTDQDFDDWRAWTQADAPPALTSDPYAVEPSTISGDAVCGFLPGADGQYTLEDFADAAKATAAGAQVTHFGTCGLCSSLSDLAVYASTPDLTEPVRACGLAHMDGDVDALTACIAELGFTDACASIWAWNTLHTRDACLAECLADLDAPYNNPDGTLNDCLQCDEDESGPVFSAVAGRTRRNTGLASSICRPCDEVRPLVHAYGAP